MPTTPAAVATAVTYQVASGLPVGCGDSSPVAPVAEFIGSPTSGTVPFTTTFTNQSTGVYLSLAWNFGDGGSSTSANPTHAYTSAGNYTVTLTLTWAGGTVTRTRTSYVTASAPAAATAQQLSGSTSGTNNSPTTLTVTLNGPVPSGGGTTTISAPGAALSTSTLAWTFGGATSQTFTITRATAGTTTGSITNSMGLSNGSSLSYTSSAAPSAGTPQPFTLTSATSDTLPFTVGHAFRQGDIPSGSGIVISGATAQATIKNAWPDGSAKFAIIAGTYTSAGSAVTVTPSAGTASTGTALTTADLIATGITAEFATGGTFGTASFGSAEWAAPFQSWVSGHRMSSWIYRKQIGSDAHLVAWLEVRLYLGGAVEVLPWIENGYLKVASPTNKSATYSFTLGGTVRNGGGQVIDLKHHQRTPLVSGTALSYWLSGTDPGVTAKHSSAYLMATELVPTYWATVAPAASLVTGLRSSFTPLQTWAYNYSSDGMASSGYQHPIGLLPLHDVVHLTTTADTYAAVVREGYSAGRWGTHYRDESTNKPVRFQDRPNLVIADSQGFKDNGASTTSDRTAIATGGNPPQWDTAHSPSVGYLAYLITGRFYFLEEVQFVATANYLGNGDNAGLRSGAQGLVQTAVDAWQTRSCAWDWRSKVQALTVTPDSGAGSEIRTDLINCVEANIAHFHGRYVAQANNQFGLILPGETYNSVIDEIAIWQQDFVTAAFGWSVSMDLPIGTTPKSNLAAFFQWKAKSTLITLGLPGASTEWPYYNSAPYTIKLGGSARGQSAWTAGTGPWPADAAAILTATTTPSAPTWFAAFPGPLTFEFQPTADEACKGVFGNRLPALAYAVRHGVTGAYESFIRLTSASNWPTIEAAFDARPVWGIRPASGDAPAWASAVAVGQIKSVGGAGAGGASVDAYNGWAYRPDSGELFIAAAGGHQDSFDNRVVSCDLKAASLSWTLRKASTGSVSVTDQEYQADGTPSSRHNYQETRWVAAQNRVMLFGCYAPYGPGVTTQDAVDGFNPSTNTWDAAGIWPNITAGYYARSQEGTGDVWSLPGNGLARKFTASTGVFSSPAVNSVGSGVRFPWSWNGTYMYGLCWGDGQGFNSGVNSIRHATTTQTAIAFNASSAYTQFQTDAPQYAGMDYSVTDGKFYFYDGRGSTAGRIFTITPNGGTTWDMGIFSPGSGSDTPPATVSAGVHNRWTFVTVGRVKGFVFMPSASAGLYFLRTE